MDSPSAPSAIPSRIGPLAVAVVLALTIGASAYVFVAPAPEVDATAAGGDLGNVRPSRVGLQPYNGPVTAAEVQAACAGLLATAAVGCWSSTLSDLLEGKGAVVAFDALEGLTTMDATASQQGHAMAHGLGRYAFDAYGSIGLALTECSYKVFGGCVHGALQSYFDSLGRAVQPADIVTVCPDDNQFTQYTCLHGLGHGLMLNLNYDINASGKLCEALDGWFAEESCYGGLFMENWVGYLDSISPTAAGGHDDGHHGGPPPVFSIKAEDPAYPCNSVPDRWGRGCWIMQTSIMLYFNHNDFEAAARVCEAVTVQDFRDTCFKSLGRDSSPQTNHDVLAAQRICKLVPSGAAHCIRGFVADVTLLNVDPMEGVAACKLVDADLKRDCYQEMAWQSVGMVGPVELARICKLVDAGYEDDCRAGGQI